MNDRSYRDNRYGPFIKLDGENEVRFEFHFWYKVFRTSVEVHVARGLLLWTLLTLENISKLGQGSRLIVRSGHPCRKGRFEVPLEHKELKAN